MSESNLSNLEEVRAIAVREANYFLGFVRTPASSKNPASPDYNPNPTQPRLTDVLIVADAICTYIKTGSKPNDNSS